MNQIALIESPQLEMLAGAGGFNPPVTPVKRPGWMCESIRRIVAEKLAPEVMAWDRDAKEKKPEDYVKDLEKALDYEIDWDGFNLGKTLEDHCNWAGVDRELVEILDNAHSYRADADAIVMADWVKLTQPKQEFNLGDTVFFDLRMSEKICEGVVIEVRADTARYWVRSLTHCHKEREGYILDWEDVRGMREKEVKS